MEKLKNVLSKDGEEYKGYAQLKKRIVDFITNSKTPIKICPNGKAIKMKNAIKDIDGYCLINDEIVCPVYRNKKFKLIPLYITTDDKDNNFLFQFNSKFPYHIDTRGYDPIYACNHYNAREGIECKITKVVLFPIIEVDKEKIIYKDFK